VTIASSNDVHALWSDKIDRMSLFGLPFILADRAYL